MNDRNFWQMLKARWSCGNFVCVGLDTEFGKIPQSVKKDRQEDLVETIVAFNNTIVEATKDLVCAYKPNAAFYEACGADGIIALRRTIADIRAIAPDVPVIFDAKRADIGDTNIGYMDAAFGFFGADAITVNPYLGAEALQPFLARADKGIFVLCRTSNPGAGEFQDLPVNGEPLYRIVARRVASEWNKNGNCALVVGATYPDELRDVRRIVGDMPLLIPGIGAQGGDLEKTVRASKDSRGWGMIINSSRAIIFSSQGADFAAAARRETEKLRNLINQYL
ncbi:MAG TPA: orotidine-5'-phosphate decarboxylase [Oligoflexia bacterium]|nr:orotidine-5'-phosphate decarboxylase [Oligoflexia bacterium]HMP27113.1 orotidine-5'-phosphate decarboxylase [Oligoflexia bacterium]